MVICTVIINNITKTPLSSIDNITERLANNPKWQTHRCSHSRVYQRPTRGYGIFIENMIENK